METLRRQRYPPSPPLPPQIMMKCVSVFPKYVAHKRGSQKKKGKTLSIGISFKYKQLYNQNYPFSRKNSLLFLSMDSTFRLSGGKVWNSKWTVSFTLSKAQTIERLGEICFPLAPTTIFPPTLKVNTLFTIMPLGRLLTYENVQNVCKDPSRSAKRCRLQGI